MASLSISPSSLKAATRRRSPPMALSHRVTRGMGHFAAGCRAVAMSGGAYGPSGGWRPPPGHGYDQPSHHQRDPEPVGNISLQRNSHHSLDQKTPPKQNGNRRVCRVTFKIQYHVGYGQSIKIVGHGESLGFWSLANSPALQWGNEDVWSCRVELPQSSVVEYKYVVIDSYGQPTSWQTGNNNVLAVKMHQEEMEVTDNWEGLPSASVASPGGIAVSRQNQLLNWASEIESMMTSTKNELRQSRVELMAAKEEVRASRGEITHLKQQLAEARVTEKRQTAEIQLSSGKILSQKLRTELFSARAEAEEAAKTFTCAFEAASDLLSDMDFEDDFEILAKLIPAASTPPKPGTSSSLGSLSKSGEAVTSVESPASSTASTSAPTTHGWTPVSESSSPSDTTPSCESSASAVRPKLYAGGRANGSLSKSPFSGSVTRPPASSQQLQEPGHSHPHATSKATVSSGGSCWKEGGHQQGEGGLERGQHQNDPSGDKQRNRRDRISSPFADPGFHWAHQDATSSFFSSSVSEGEGHHV